MKPQNGLTKVCRESDGSYSWSVGLEASGSADTMKNATADCIAWLVRNDYLEEATDFLQSEIRAKNAVLRDALMI